MFVVFFFVGGSGLMIFVSVAGVWVGCFPLCVWVCGWLCGGGGGESDGSSLFVDCPVNHTVSMVLSARA